MAQQIVDSFEDVIDEGDYVVKHADGSFQVPRVKAHVASDTNYIVYIKADDDIACVYAPSQKFDGVSFRAVCNRMEAIRALPRTNLPKPQRFRLLQRLALAIANVLENDLAGANQALDEAAAYLHDSSIRVAKTSYISGAVLAAIALGIVGFSMLVSLAPEGNDAVIDAFALVGGAALAGGSLGSLLSTLASRRGSAGFHPFATRTMAVWNGIVRILYGCVGAFVVALAVKSGAITSDLITNAAEPLAYTLLGCAGGFTERWAEEIIRGVRGGSGENGESSAPSAKSENQPPEPPAPASAAAPASSLDPAGRPGAATAPALLGTKKNKKTRARRSDSKQTAKKKTRASRAKSTPTKAKRKARRK